MNDPLRAQQMVRRQVRRRRRWRRLRVAVLVLLASSAVVAAAYGIDRLAVVVHKFYTEHHHTRPQTTGLNHGTTSTTTTTAPGAPRCTSPQLGALVSDWRETGGTVEETVTLTNISATPCTLTGYADLGVVAQNGTPLPAPNDDLASLGAAGGPGSTAPSSPVTVAHGARASFELDFANICDNILEPGEPATGAPNECYAGVWLDVTPPGGTSPLLVTQPVRLTYATTGFQVGPFEVGGGLPLAGQPPLTSQTTSTPTP